MIHLLIVDAELELVPEHAPDARSTSLKGIRVLDAYFHPETVSGLPESDRRGRPDIIHRCLSLCQESILNRRGLLKVCIHTRGGKILDVDPGMSVPPNYVEFLDQMARLLSGERVSGYAMRTGGLQTVLGEIGADKVIAMSPSGEERDLRAVLAPLRGKDVAVIIGGFPEGDYTSPVYRLAEAIISLGPELLTVPTVVCEVLASAPKEWVDTEE